ncbi:hypothetical protein [Halovivax limisalsi]|uniref:hypothetical protein n=1 Tax=Halovivax limisalsi TaxID=1453760 RepID=UPI001FFC62E3|nr:hypothetical protein [Halovivax limisalsi]
MRELRTCDFCGDDPRGTYEIVPPELSPTEAEQRRVVLCEACRATLSELLEPLLARARGESIEGDAGPAHPADANRDEKFGTAEAASSSGPPSESGALDTGGDERHGDAAGTESGSSDADGLEESGPTGDAGSADAPDAADGRASDDRGTADAGNDGESPAAPDASAGAAAESTAPQSYGKVLRLLRNRDLPMARSDVEGLAAGAYDLESHQVEAILDRAIERGDLIEDGRQIRLG